MQYKDSYKKIKISKKDFTILRFLLQNPNSMNNSSNLAKHLSPLPRTTIIFRLKELKSREFVIDKKTGKERTWKISLPGKNILLQEQTENLKVENIFGLENIFSVFENLLAMRGRDRIYAIEPSNQVEIYHKKSILKISEQIKILDLFKEKEHISESVTGEKVLTTLSKIPRKVLENMYGRVTQITVVPDEYITFTEYIISHLGKVYFLNFETESCIIVHDKNFSDSINSMVKNLQLFGKRINLNEEIKKHLQ